jgi:ParB family transcriptional regulator, chromosome partitioning protein
MHMQSDIDVSDAGCMPRQRLLTVRTVQNWWQPTADAYLNHVPKAQIIAALKEAGPEPVSVGVEAMKKDALVTAAASRLAGTRWLPEPLR